MKKPLFLLLLFLAACGSRTETSLSSIQLVDRNGFSETISNRERLKMYDRVDFMTPQPYQKIMRIYGRSEEGKSLSKLTTYHSNGFPAQYLEVVDGRANGWYREWHSNGGLKVEAFVIEGIADLSEVSQKSWLFHGPARAWDNTGRISAEILYDKGVLSGTSTHYSPNGKVLQEQTFLGGFPEGRACFYGEDGELREEIPYLDGKKEGRAFGRWDHGGMKYEEVWKLGHLESATYLMHDGEKIAEVEHGQGQAALFDGKHLRRLTEIRDGIVAGTIQEFDDEGHLATLYHHENEMKHGDEWIYYNGDLSRPKLLCTWREDKLQGPIKSWYPSGSPESEREMQGNKRHGMAMSWYENGAIMFVEEYAQDKLIRGSYFRKGESTPISKVENGKGVATLYDKEGIFLRKIHYEKSQPLLEALE